MSIIFFIALYSLLFKIVAVVVLVSIISMLLLSFGMTIVIWSTIVVSKTFPTSICLTLFISPSLREKNNLVNGDSKKRYKNMETISEFMYVDRTN